LHQDMAATTVQRAHQLTCDQSSALRTFTGNSNAWYDCNKDFRRPSREFDDDLEYRDLCLM